MAGTVFFNGTSGENIFISPASFAINFSHLPSTPIRSYFAAMASLTLITPSGLRFWLVFCTFGSTPVREGSVFSVKFSANELSETSGVFVFLQSCWF